MLQVPTREIFAEVYPVNMMNFPTLNAWVIRTGLKDVTHLGWKLGYRLTRMVGGHWIWADSKLITDSPIDEAGIKAN